jgi:hypothetical protein
MPREAKYWHCLSNCWGEPEVQPPPKKNTIAGRSLVGAGPLAVKM